MNKIYLEIKCQEPKKYKVRINWRTKTLGKQSWYTGLCKRQIEYLLDFAKTGDFKNLGDFINYPNDNLKRWEDKDYDYLVIAYLNWAFSYHKTTKVEVILDKYYNHFCQGDIKFKDICKECNEQDAFGRD